MKPKYEKAEHCACEADMEKEVKELVDNVKGYTKADHDKKKAEVEAAFNKDKKTK